MRSNRYSSLTQTVKSVNSQQGIKQPQLRLKVKYDFGLIPCEQMVTVSQIPTDF